jgi:hypothetical protein
MVAAADAAERRIEWRGRKAGFGQRADNVTLPRRIEQAQTISRLVEAQLANGKVELEKAHATADVGTDELWMDSICQDAAADGSVFFRGAGPACRQLH